MHILVIPSERFVPEGHPLEGIFPYHQAVILAGAGYRVGALSIDLSFSVPMIAKGLLFKLIGKKAGNKTDGLSVGSLLRLGVDKVFSAAKFIKREMLDGVEVYRVDALYRRKPVANKNHVSWVKAGLLCFDVYVKEKGRPDVVHAHEAIYAGLLAQEIQQKYKIPYVLTEHSTFYATGHPGEDILQRVKKVYMAAKGLFAVSESFASFLNTKFGLRRFCYLPNVLDIQLEAAPFEKGANPNQSFRFLNIALFKPVKDQLTLLKAFKEVVNRVKNVELCIGGSGALEADLKSFVEGAGLQKNVRFLGVLSREEVMAELNRCDCFVLSSKYETFGVVIIEALLFGKPVISTSVGVAPDIIKGETGFVVNVGDEKELAEAMLKTINGRAAYEAEGIRRFAIAEFGKEAFVKRMNKIYSEVT